MKSQYSTKGNKISCGRFDDIVPEIEKLQVCSPSIRRISYSSRKKPADSNSIKPTLIATDGERIYFEKRWHDARDILLKINEKTRRDIFVLTKKEKYQLVELEIETGAKIYAFEKNFPFIQDAAVFPDPEKRIKHMERGLSWLKKEGIEEKSLGRHTSKKNLHLIARKVRFKSTLDHWFAFTSQSSIDW